jgi:hypothetical protein
MSDGRCPNCKERLVKVSPTQTTNKDQERISNTSNEDDGSIDTSFANVEDSCETESVTEQTDSEVNWSPLPNRTYSNKWRAIKPSQDKLGQGIGVVVTGLLLFFYLLSSSIRKLPETVRGVEVGLIVGRCLVPLILVIIGIKIILKAYSKIDINKVLAELDNPDNSKRKEAAKTLVDRRWIPSEVDQEVKILVATQKYKKTLALGGFTINRLVETLTIKNVDDGKVILKAIQKNGSLKAVPLLIDLLAIEETVVSKEQIVKTLQKITGQRIDNNPDQWNAWLESKHNM